MAALTADLSTVQVKLRNAVYLYPMQKRVTELTYILQECSMKDFQNMFPFLVEHIFGVNPTFGTGWNLLVTSRSNNCGDFDALYTFLHPLGTLFEIIYKLLGDVYSKYEYPVALLPQRVKQMILDGNVPPFFADKLQIDPNLRVPTALTLSILFCFFRFLFSFCRLSKPKYFPSTFDDPFEFYLYHFAFHLINSWQDHDSFAAGCDTIYLHLSDQYLQHFLPIDTSVVLPVVPMHQALSIPRSPSPQAQPQATPKLFKSSAVKIGSNSLSPPVVTQPHAEVWRSEAFIQIMIYFWLSVSDHPLTANPFAKTQNFNYYPPPPPMYGQYARMPKFYCYPEMRTPEGNLPRESHLRVVRNMIKHVHYFVNNFHNDGSAIDELRKIAHGLYRRPLYTFLRRNIHHWPLDSSFLLMLETYLSFIQPWRYVKYDVRSVLGRAGSREESPVVDHRWYNFIVDNFPAYTVLLREIIPRFLRMDLTSPKHAHMLYRLSKVLSLPNLADMLRDIEASLDESAFADSYLVRSPKSPASPGSPGNSVHVPVRRNTIIQQQFHELESPNFQYRPLFDHEFRTQVHEFIANAQRSLVLVQDWLHAATAQQKMKKSGLLQSLRDFLFWTTSSDDYTIDERRKTATYLEVSILFLSSAFEISLPEIFDRKASTVDKSTSTTGVDVADAKSYVEPTILDPKIWRKRTKLIRYDANPDAEPIKSTEVTFLVRFFHQISTRINESYGNRFVEYWNRNDVWGLIARQLLAPPCRYHYFDKSVPGNFARRVSVELPPRITLRSLASHKTLSYIFLSGFLAFLYQYPVIPFYVFVFCLYVALIVVKAFVLSFIGRRRQQATSPEPFVPLDVSFND